MDGGADTGQDGGQERLTIQEAARRLGVSEGAIRKRVARGTLEHDKAPDGRIYVYLDARGRRGVDDRLDEGVHPESNALTSQLRSEIDYLREENRRKDDIIMQQALTVRQLTAGSEEPPESPEPRSEAPTTQPAGGPEDGTQGRISALRKLRKVVALIFIVVAAALVLVVVAGFVAAYSVPELGAALLPRPGTHEIFTLVAGIIGGSLPWVRPCSPFT
jgi:hypothetical protein